VHAAGVFLVGNTLVTYGFFIMFHKCSYAFLAPACTQISDPHTRQIVNSIGGYAMMNLIFRFMAVVGFAMDFLAGWYAVHLVRLVLRRKKNTQARPVAAAVTS
jgi:hypothetical protein